ncbi:glutamine synthetase [Breznakia sp. PF5-3]|uniref:glutamine synthetase family protein n=1 Tax=unclassified Breznakia TaxID=2623764 RepID=UPI002406C4D9|nr:MULTISPECIES: glutamine synthetase family protein [unclassified Breznakia]MDF9825013.1 glutamine synthetase [Breznakia sp. PM6-1]MDF9835416.1 glutamine synthetase [Breznakia sp. PF5-3]MDF9837648.1 glutamine synthetase [Breznakia sp. PFB2-8]MDF9859512.1 glutamine synthetase [Breznakia sp. PH5-24]
MKIEKILRYIELNHVKFVRLAFCDIFGTLKNLSINADDFEQATEEGINLDASDVNGFMNYKKTDLLLYPDLDTMTILPWRSGHEKVVRFFCDIRHLDGTPFEGDGRYFLKQAMEACESYGYTPKIGIESEFYLFQNDVDGNPTNRPIDHASYLDVTPLDGGENIRREICLSLEEMGVKTKMSYHEKGPGQNVITFEDNYALQAADNLITFKNCVKSIALLNDLYASFLPRPLADASGSGLRIKVTLSKNDRNIFEDDYEVNLEEQRNFIAGVLNRTYEMSLFLNPINNSYERLGSEKAPKYITWAEGNQSQLLRVDEKQDEYSYIMLRSADAACNPYYAYGLLLYAGIEGMRKSETLSEGHSKSTKELPKNLKEAVESVQNSEFVKEVINKKTVTMFCEIKSEEAASYKDEQRFDSDPYFKLI